MLEVLLIAQLFVLACALYILISNRIYAEGEWERFNERIERESKIPAYPTSTPKIENARLLVRAYCEKHKIKRKNGGIECDIVDGPCSCGAWHNDG